jgi:CubicO group peptidase (beta-lactamase class C family)
MKSLTLHQSCIIFIISTSLLLNSCLPYQAFLYIIPDHKDIRRFKHEEVKHAEDCYSFMERTSNKSIVVSNWNYASPLHKSSLEDFLKEHEANQFLVIKNDSIVFEYIDHKITEYTPAPTYSVSKSFVSAIFGVALQEGYISSINDLVKTYLPELNYHKNFDYLTINHLLNQSSGLKMEVDNISDAYYGKIEKVLTGLHFTSKPGEKLEYINENTTLLGIIIERTTGKNLHDYFSEKIWSKIGTCDSAVWGYDYKTKHTRAFCCFGTSTRDYAKFGKLYLNKGNWNNQQLIDSNWVISSTSRVNSLGENVGYNNFWYIGDKDVGDYMALGMYRQQIYINPKNKVIIVCLLKFNGNNLPLRWWQLLRQVAEQA